MKAQQVTQPYQRKVTGAERFFSHAPFSTVTMVARIKGKVTEELLKNAVHKVQQRHALLRVRIRDSQDGDLWFTSDGVGQISHPSTLKFFAHQDSTHESGEKGKKAGDI